MAVNDVYLVSARALLNGQVIVNTLAFRALDSTTHTVTTLQAVANDIKASLRGSQVDDLTYTDWRALKVRGSGVTYSTSAPFRVSTVAFAAPYTSNLAGVQTLTPTSNLDAAVIRVSTGEAGRRRKGRIYMAGLYETAIDDNSLLASSFTSAVQSALSTNLGPYLTTGGSTVWRLGVWSDRIAMNVALSNTWPRVRTSQGSPDPDSAFADAVSLDVQQYVGAQRGRRPGI